MICYQLCCANGHTFEGWYRDSTAFARLKQENLLSCAICGTAKVEQALMAPAIVKGRSHLKQKEPSKPEAMSQQPEAPPAPQQLEPVVSDNLISALRQIRAAVEENCENVGSNFADEALRIHYGEAPERSIYGDMTASEREMLEDEGVDVLPLPWVRKTDS
ncbi:DUF1178 family protein [Acetobacter oryzifermentans]|uniref:DUF1178 domain-containing protein n=1 Tax=Acetobacter oryzifermentans TaxID=1633874 RepID=A0ABN4NTS0_9PROT|nr:DUF1178 family protein [Acetobacter oryzifermentans]ANA13648.1 hypothetical protein WG31_06140 [Acetobacter oryzifermentans]